MIMKRNKFKKQKEKKVNSQKRIAYIDLKYNIDKTLQEIKNKKP